MVKELGFAELFHNTKEGVLLVHYADETEIDLEKAKSLIESVKIILQDGKTPFGITDATAKRLHITTAARNAYKDNPAMRLNKKHAIIVEGLSNRILANAFIRLDKPVIPTKIFKDIATAETWLLSSE
jgi:hypothetical protein